MNVRIFNKFDNDLPDYATEASAGMDLRASEPTTIFARDRRIVKTGIFIELPVGFEAQIRPRSGLAFKEGITVLNSPGTIDADYRGEIGVILYNSTDQDFEVHIGDKIAQMVIARHEKVSWNQVDDVSDLHTTTRGAGGFGHTGK